MASFLFAVWPFPGHIYPNIAVAKSLQERHHAVAFYTGAKVSALLEHEGIACFRFEHIQEDAIDRLVWSKEGISGHRKNPWMYRKLLRKWLTGTIPAQISDLDNVLKQYSPDVIVCDPALWAPFLILHQTRNIPVAILSYTASCMLPGPDIPPFGLGMPKPKRSHTKAFNRAVSAIVEAFMQDGQRDANALRAEYGLAPIRTSVTQFAASMPLYMIPSTPEFDLCRADLPPAVHYIGPCSWDQGAASSTLRPWDDLNGERPLVYVTEGTLRSSEPFLLQTALKALTDAPVCVLMTTGTHRDPQSLARNRLPSNIRVERYVPMSAFIGRTDVVVTTGGSGTVMTAIKAGVPLVVVPTEWDQPENARRVAESGVGLRLSRRQCSARRLRQSIMRVLNDSFFRSNAGILAEKCRSYGGPRQAAILLTELAASPCSRWEGSDRDSKGIKRTEVQELR